MEFQASVGIDLSSRPEKTAACVIRWDSPDQVTDSGYGDEVQILTESGQLYHEVRQLEQPPPS